MGGSQPARHGAFARLARVLCLLPRDSQRSGARACATRKQTGTSHQGVAPKERGLPPVRCPFIWHVRSQSARHGACARLARVLRLLPRASQRSDARACATRKKAGTSHRCCTERERPTAGAVFFHRAWRSQPGRHGARARLARVLRLFSRETAALARVMQNPAVYWRPQLACRTMVLNRWRELSCRRSALP